jgi:ankyrin repeat protein
MVRSSLGSAVLEGGTSTSSSYPFYAMPVPELLNLTAWEPHQDLVAQGKVVEITPESAVQVLFVSHQWASFEHPDPSCAQLHALQAVVKKLMAGETSVESNVALTAVYGTREEMTGAEWKATLPNMLVWFDYISIPQPGALTKKLSAEMVATLDVDGDGQVTQDELKHAPAKVAQQDHRLMTETDVRVAELVEQLKAAVDSIPSYLERSALMWILVPPVEHRDLSNVICDFNSWRSRGWCRLEFAAAKLATGEDMKIMLIQDTERSGDGHIEFFNPCDTFKLAASKGNFSVEEDRSKVNATLANMLQAKSAYFGQLGDTLLARLTKVYSPVFVPRSELNIELPAVRAAEGELAPANESALSRMHRFLGWGGEEEEAALVAESGWTSLIFACCLNDEAAVDELLAATAHDPKARKTMLDAKAVKLVQFPGAKNVKYAHRTEPFCQLFCAYAELMTPLLGAMTFASPPIVQKLIDAGANVKRDGLKLLGELPCHFRGAVLTGNLENVQFFLSRFPQYINKKNSFGSTPLHFACYISSQAGQAEMVELMLKLGAATSVEKSNLFVGTPLQILSQTYDSDLRSVELIIEAGGLTNRGYKIPGIMKYLIGPMAKRMAHKNAQMYGFTKLLAARREQAEATPCHFAVRRGDTAMLAKIADYTDLSEVKDKAGRTVVDVAKEKLPSPLPQLVEAVQGKSEGTAPARAATVGKRTAKKSAKGAGDQVLPNPPGAAE